MRQISAGIIIYQKTPEGPKFLILYERGNYWNFPKGKIEEEERAWETAVREVQEETGLRLRDLKFKKNFKTYEKYFFQRQGQKIFKVVIFYLAETKKQDIKISEEHQGFGWFSYKEAEKILSKHKDSQRVLTQAYEFLKQKQEL